MNLSDFSKQNWLLASIGGSFLGGMITGGLGWTLSTAFPMQAAVLSFVTGAVLFFLLITLVGSVNVKLNNIQRRVNESESELRAMVNVRPLLDDIPLQYGGWAMDAHLAETIAQLLLEEQPQLVLECGSGSSSLLVASCLKKLGGNRQVISLDHESKYAEITRGLLKQHNLDEWARVITAPLKQWRFNGKELPWYGVELGALPDQAIDMIIVDGPPGVDDPMARYPAVPVLKQHLSDECIIILDDGDRPGERKAAHRWEEVLDGNLEYAGGTLGSWILRRSSR